MFARFTRRTTICSKSFAKSGRIVASLLSHALRPYHHSRALWIHQAQHLRGNSSHNARSIAPRPHFLRQVCPQHANAQLPRHWIRPGIYGPRSVSASLWTPAYSMIHRWWTHKPWSQFPRHVFFCPIRSRSRCLPYHPCHRCRQNPRRRYSGHPFYLRAHKATLHTSRRCML